MNNPDVLQINAFDLKERLDHAPGLCLIDVREQEEWDIAHIPRAIHIPKDLILDKISQVAPDKHQAIYLYCHSGMRSTLAAGWLLQAGYKEVYSVAGGISLWESYGFSLQS
jgi:adenylyltransferase/sulfurtransferase